MSQNLAPTLKVGELFESRKEAFKLALLAGEKGLQERGICVPDIYRPGLALAGYFNFFAFERVQIMGRTELSYLDSLPAARRAAILKRFFSYPVTCIIITQGIRPPRQLLDWARRRHVPLFLSTLATTRLVSDLSLWLEERLAPRAVSHGTLVEIYGLGVLLLGKSGVGKSECALELIKRGHRLVADDLVHLKRTPQLGIVGWGDELIRHHMEVRGLGIIDVKELFGVGAVRQDVPVDLVIAIEEWVEGKEYDRMGLDESSYPLLDLPLPYLLIPVRPGRTLAVIVEVAAMNQRLKKTGHNTARAFNDRVMEFLQHGEAPAPHPRRRS
jgi:HPr kinase/phosphorylase